MSWRQSFSDQERGEIAQALRNGWQDKYSAGVAHYGDQFQGDPLKHAYEEVLDLVSYVTVAVLHRNDLIEVLHEVLHTVDLPGDLRGRISDLVFDSTLPLNDSDHNAWHKDMDTRSAHGSSEVPDSD